MRALGLDPSSDGSMLACRRGSVKQGKRRRVAVAVHARDEKSPPKASLDRLTTLLQDDLKRVNVLILERMRSPVALIPQLAGHIIAAGGKRLRPMLTLATARLCGYRGDR